MVDYQKLFMTILHGLLNINVFFVVLVVLCSICTEFQHVLRNISVTVCFFGIFVSYSCCYLLFTAEAAFRILS